MTSFVLTFKHSIFINDQYLEFDFNKIIIVVNVENDILGFVDKTKFFNYILIFEFIFYLWKRISDNESQTLYGPVEVC